MSIFAFIIIALLVLWQKTSKIYSPIKTLAKILSILNLENASQKSKVSVIWNNVLELLKNDREYIKLYFGESNIYENLSGLKLAHNEAFKNLEYVTYENESYTNLPKIKSIINRADESNLYNKLIAHDMEAVKELIISYQSKLNTTDSQTKKNFYAKILSIILRVLQEKNISFSESKQTDYEFITDVLDNQFNDIHNVILELINKLNIYAKKKDINNIISYITENDNNKDLSLEFIAAEFNTNPSYVSIFVKNNLKLGFHEYLTNLRVSEAKALLLKTKMPIPEIGETVGFSSRTTFFRSFKQSTGITPSEFRNSGIN